MEIFQKCYNIEFLLQIRKAIEAVGIQEYNKGDKSKKNKITRRKFDEKTGIKSNE